MNNPFVRRELVLECLSPVHIGGGGELKAYEYLYEKVKDMAYFVDEAKWVRFLSERKLIDKFAKELTLHSGQYEKGWGIWDWLVKNGAAAEEIRSLAARKARVRLSDAAGRDTLNDLHCHITQGDGRPYIPGSSIKGALRTGILRGLLERRPEIGEKYGKKVMEKLKAASRPNWLKNDLKKLNTELERELLGVLDPLQGRSSKKKVTGEVRDVLRGLLVSDAVCQDPEQETIVLQKIDATLDERGGVQNRILPIWRECLPTGTKLRFSVTLDLAMMKKIGIEDFDAVLDMVRCHIKTGLELQDRAFGREYAGAFRRAESADLMLGGGTGFLSKTITYTLFSSDKEAFECTRSLLDILFKKHKHAQRDKWISPRTLKLCQNQVNEREIMGLCRIEEAQSC